MKRPFPLLVRALALTASAAILAFAQPASAQSANAPATYPYTASRAIPGRYIVVFKNDVTDPAASAATLVRGVGGQLHHTYKGALKGFAAAIPDAALQGLRNNPHVSYIEQDQTVSLQQVSSPQNQATWGLDRIDQADRPLDTQYHFSASGSGVNAFVIDTGIRADHVEFTGRLRPGYDAVADGNGTNDCHGHGTHVAGTIAGTTWGVAKAASIIPVRVFGCTGSGSWSAVIAGVDWVANSPLRPAVANMSLSGGASAAVDAAVAGAVGKGVTIVVAAGNSNVDACGTSPAREPSAITVGASTSSDTRSFYSNLGACLDLFAPGTAITSAWYTGATASNTISGTSMASAHVSGAAVLTLQANPTASPATVAAYLNSTATPNRLTSIGTGSPNLLLYALGNGATAPAPTTQTVALKSMVGNATKSGGNWKASAVVTVRDVNSGAMVANAAVAGTFSPGGSASCVTGSNGSCSLSSSMMKSSASASSTLSATGISGTLMNYDASQNAVSQIIISKP
ncbi:S8 family peptidase [Ramlibacter sp. WS9]|uniref:S8 family peptidase n=1 Tax=Ramlibacter sp. WS9 TaxID=1882741 RepID=UPI0011422B1C|nr:S8 family peptidase [Ramlibacter sp. WS9]ROZ77732.1 S8 family peptidase [Ramlibacter sp. WS9]